ncbi:unnamed protein product [Symbiodinium sp. CCMP2592]|nr:unnamed protein product [Symbiodinium sp. CCMP2592]
MKKWFWHPFKRTSFKHQGYYGQSTPPCIDTERDMLFSFIAKLPNAIVQFYVNRDIPNASMYSLEIVCGSNFTFTFPAESYQAGALLNMVLPGDAAEFEEVWYTANFTEEIEPDGDTMDCTLLLKKGTDTVDEWNGPMVATEDETFAQRMVVAPGFDQFDWNISTEAIFDNTDEDDWLANTPISGFCQDEGYIPITVRAFRRDGSVKDTASAQQDLGLLTPNYQLSLCSFRDDMLKLVVTLLLMVMVATRLFGLRNDCADDLHDDDGDADHDYGDGR